MSYVRFYSDASFTLGTYGNVKLWSGAVDDGKLEYSINTSTWIVWDGSAPISAALDSNTNKYNLYLRGTANYALASYNTNLGLRYVFTGTQLIDSEGVIGSLFDYSSVDNNIHTFSLNTGACCLMFYNQTLLRTAPNIDFNNISTYGCYGMFYGCTSLIIPPKLLATTLAQNCYTSMFYGCTALTTAPKLPATTLATGCYAGMFYDCTSLIIPPELPATTIGNISYVNMFYNSGIKLSTTQHDDYTLAYRIPSAGTGTQSYPFINMFYGSGVDTPSINTTYYVKDTQYKSSQIELGAIAQTIRNKAEISSSLTFPEDYITEINNIVVDIDNTYLISQAVPSDALGADGDICVVYN